MNKKAFIGVLMAFALPLTCYLVIRNYSNSVLAMPNKYIYDSVVTSLKNGKTVTDTAWHRVKDFKLQNQLGETVSLDKFHGKVIIADFFFTKCPTICPPMTLNMKRLQESLKNTKRVGDKSNKFVHFLSFSIDPERDSVPALKAWADRFQINPEQWDLLTGDKKTIYDFALNEIKLGLVDGEGVDTSFVHSSKFVLIDSSRHIRGYYDGLDSSSLAQLSRDAVLLTLEKDHHKKSALAGKLQLLAIVFLIAAIIVGIFLIAFKKKK